MFESVSAFSRRCLVSAFGIVVCSASMLVGTAQAQTIVLNQAGSQVTDTTLRSGAYSNTNFDNAPLITRRSTSDPDWERRALLKFDTDNYVPSGAQIASATLTLTVKSGLGSSGQARTVKAFRVIGPFLETDATWLTRMDSTRWSTPGGDLGEQVASAAATNVAGAKVTFDVTDLVQQTVAGQFDTKYTRILLVDGGSEAKESYREYYGSEEATSSRRPTLTIQLAAGSSPPPSSSTSNTLKVMQWNIKQGYGADGKSNIDRVVDFIVSKRPDIISFNEIMRYSSSSQPQMIADKLKAKTGQTWSYKWVQKSGAASGEGECVMTHLDVDATDDYLLSNDRSVAMLRVNVNGRIINAFSTHLDANSSSIRLSQVKQLVSWADNYAEQRIIAGDFNFWPGTGENTEMNKTHYDGWVSAKSKGTAVSYSSNPDGNTKNTRIDYVWYSKGATALSVTRAEVYYTKTTISDHNAVMVTFQVR
jgi:endonuclease/exonuclease/phosphatase family metal-dependent hydrolase